MSNTDSSNIKQKIQAALTLLKKEKHLDKIKVSEVTLLAGIGRSTFYRYYHDVYAVFEEMVDEFAERCIEIMKFFCLIRRAKRRSLKPLIFPLCSRFWDFANPIQPW